MIDLEKMHQVFHSIPDEVRCLYIDTFASCCWMSQQGETVAANKLLLDLFNRINLISENNNDVFFASIRRTLKGNEEKYALAVPLRAEFRLLFKK